MTSLVLMKLRWLSHSDEIFVEFSIFSFAPRHSLCTTHTSTPHRWLLLPWFSFHFIFDIDNIPRIKTRKIKHTWKHKRRKMFRRVDLWKEFNCIHCADRAVPVMEHHRHHRHHRRRRCISFWRCILTDSHEKLNFKQSSSIVKHWLGISFN